MMWVRITPLLIKGNALIDGTSSDEIGCADQTQQ